MYQAVFLGERVRRISETLAEETRNKLEECVEILQEDGDTVWMPMRSSSHLAGFPKTSAVTYPGVRKTRKISFLYLCRWGEETGETPQAQAVRRE